MNQLSTIAAAVTAALTAASPLAGNAFEVTRHYIPPDYEASATDELQVLVVAFEEDVDIHGPNATSDGQCDHVYSVKVVIQKRITAGVDVTSTAALAELDALGNFREAVLDFLKAKANRAQGNGQLDSLKNGPSTYDPKALDEDKVYVSVVVVNYRLTR